MSYRAPFYLLLFCRFILAFSFLYAEEQTRTQEDKPLKIGNLSLRNSQQPGPLVGFGDHVVDKGQVILFLPADEYKREKGYMTDLLPNLLYGITDKLSVMFTLPFAPRYKEGDQRSAGLEDAFVQFEYAYYDAQRQLSTDQATVVAGIAFPTGSFKKNPRTGFGSPHFFLGATYNYTSIDWFYFGAVGTAITTSHRNNKAGGEYLYQIGLGRNVATPPGWIFAWMIEANGVYASKDTVKGRSDPNSGGNVVYLTPSLWASSEHIVLQLGAGGVLTQNLFGNQSKFTHQVLFNLGLTF